MERDNRYDIVVSLGGNCAPAMHLRRDGKRHVSLPFDWLYLVDDRPIRWLVGSLETDCADFALKENLERIGPGHPEFNTEDPGKVKYLDRLTGYRLIHHFLQTVDTPGEYERFSGILKKRMRRFFDLIAAAKDVLFVLNVKFPIADELLVSLHGALTRRFPTVRRIDLQVLRFGEEEPFADREPFHGVYVRDIRRRENIYDYHRTSIEWDFLDNVVLVDRAGDVRRAVEESRRSIWRTIRRMARWILPYGIVSWMCACRSWRYEKMLRGA